VDSCIVLHTREALTNTVGILVVDVVLLLAMLIGLLRHSNSVGIWKLLYQQVTPGLSLRVPEDTEFLPVYNLDSVGHDCGDSTRGLSLSAIA
jgi:hypothetical protein